MPTTRGWKRRTSGRRTIRPTPIAISRRGRSSATRTCTPASRWMPARSARGSTPRDAYRFARGEQVMASSGQPAKLSRPLDFLVVADHSDNMGFFPDLLAGKPEMLADPTGRKWYDMIQAGQGQRGRARDHRHFLAGHVSRRTLMYFPGTNGLPRRVAGDHRRRRGLQRAGPLHRLHRLRVDLEHRGNNLHRNVIFRDNADKASQVEPFTCYAAARQQQSRATCGSGWTPTKRRPAAACSPSRTTAT